MNLKEVRTLFIKKSGRYDLMTDDYLDNGADFYIQAGQKMLERKTDVNGSSFQFELTEDDDDNAWTIDYPELLVIASLYQLEGGSRGSGDINKHASFIKDATFEISKTFVEKDSYDIDKMEG